VLVIDEKLEALVRELPDENGARVFLNELSEQHPRTFRNLVAEPGLMSDALALATWSPLLATTLIQNPDYHFWLNRERSNSRVRTCDELRESLARFALMNSSLNPQILLARFRRRELLRIYLHDLRRTQTIVETTEELSNLADAILDYALSLARQDLENKHGLPQYTDENGRVATADFCIMALGKLGSFELNYSSDIDLVFLYSDDGTTSGQGARGEVSNREYFVKLSETVARLVGLRDRLPGRHGLPHRRSALLVAEAEVSDQRGGQHLEVLAGVLRGDEVEERDVSKVNDRALQVPGPGGNARGRGDVVGRGAHARAPRRARSGPTHGRQGWRDPADG